MTSQTSPRTTIVIAVKADNPNLRECLEHCGRLEDQDFEILVLPDIPCELKFPKTRVISTGPAGPSIKRDLGIEQARGSIVAFLDDDVYPAPGWLTAAVQALKPNDVAAVGGPAVTPPHDGDREQASGLVYASRWVSGPFVYRYIPRPARDVDDYPTCNLIIKRTPLQAIGGFNTCFWPGEDTVVCLKLTQRLKQRIVYDPGVLVYHHRRPLFSGHLKQVTSYAQHRGYFVKKFPATSLRVGYFVPSIFLMGLTLGWIPTWWWGWVWLYLWLAGVGIYVAIVLAESFRAKPRRLAAWVFAGTVATHVAYGFYFLQGLFAGQLNEEPVSLNPKE
jgi:GT2 family glycosyltransferase